MKQVLAVLSVVALTIVVALAQQTPTDQQIKITNGPGVDNLSSNAAEVFWNTDEKSASVVHGTSRDILTESAEAPDAVTDHKVQLKNLQPDTTYYFQVISSQLEGGAADVKSDIGTFTTPSASQAQNDKDASQAQNETNPDEGR